MCWQNQEEPKLTIKQWREIYPDLNLPEVYFEAPSRIDPNLLKK